MHKSAPQLHYNPVSESDIGLPADLRGFETPTLETLQADISFIKSQQQAMKTILNHVTETLQIDVSEFINLSDENDVPLMNLKGR